MLNPKLKDKVVLILGGSSGIGLSCAIALGKEGAIINIVGRTTENIKKTEKEFKEYKIQCTTYKIDISTDKKNNFIDKIIKIHKKIDILINCVGINRYEKSFMSHCNEIFDTNFFGPLRIIRKVIPILKKQNFGNIINISSILSSSYIKNQESYCASKAALSHLTKMLSNELAPNIRVNCINPGIIKTPMSKEFCDSSYGMSAMKNIPLKRFGDSKELDALIIFLSSELSSYITGASLAIDGGLSSQPLFNI